MMESYVIQLIEKPRVGYTKFVPFKAETRNVYLGLTSEGFGHFVIQIIAHGHMVDNSCLAQSTVGCT